MRSKGVIHIFTGAYSLVRKTGLLELPLLRRGFVASSFLYKKWYEDPFWGLVGRSPGLFQGGDILDIGANIGYTAWVFAQAITPGAKIYAFEPDQSTFELFKEVIRWRRLEETIEPLNMAVGSSEGHLEFWHNKDHSADHRVVTEEFRKVRPNEDQFSSVAVTTVDQFVAARKIKRLSFIKIDVQGYEVAVCQGMNETLQRFPKMSVCLEYSPEGLSELGFNPNDVLEFFRARNYEFHMLTRRETIRVQNAGTIQTMLDGAGYVDLLCMRSNQGIRKK